MKTISGFTICLERIKFNKVFLSWSGEEHKLGKLQTSDETESRSAKLWTIHKSFCRTFLCKSQQIQRNQFSINHFLLSFSMRLCCLFLASTRKGSIRDKKPTKNMLIPLNFLSLSLILFRLSSTTMKMVIETKENDYEA